MELKRVNNCEIMDMCNNNDSEESLYSPIKNLMSQMNAVSIYKKVLSEKYRFPVKFWLQENSLVKAAEVTRYLIEEVLNWNDEKIIKDFNRDIVKDYKLGGMLSICFKGSVYKMLNNAYPDRFNPLDLGSLPKDVWKDKDLSCSLVKWLIEVKLSLYGDNVTKIRKLDFVNNGLKSILQKTFNSNLYEAINAVYPGKFQPWQFNCTKNYWTKELAIESIRWMIENKMDLSYNEFLKEYGPSCFEEYNLRSMLRICFDGDAYKAIDAAYPGTFKKSDFEKLKIYE